ncbi:GNAT family N-acetyltransferase [Motiliproteus sediminis]|uniref:GNAT family N-acetyltransferase n=1 Tax=Motiliproteus sediminis TaxID=1468178 RepID=UPI001AEFB989|nr:GNAT family N-acetyltransferase [Motiliproteus sediminis]
MRRELTLRHLQAADAAALWQLLYLSVHRVGRKRYRQRQCEAWAPSTAMPDGWPERLAATTTWVAEAAGEPLGFASLERGGVVDLFYIHPGWQRRGVGSALMRQLEAEARQRDIGSLQLQASLSGLAFFERVGFMRRGMQLRRLRGRSFIQFLLYKGL